MADDQVNRIRKLLESFETAMLVTHGGNDSFHARPMAIARLEDNCDLWFFTGTTGAKVQEIQNDQRVLIVCQDKSRYISLRGLARLVLDRDKARELWKESLKTWFPKGVADPGLMLIQVLAEEAEYWESTGAQPIHHLFETARAFVRGTQPGATEEQQHGTVSFPE